MIAQVAIVTANTETTLYTLTAADDLYISGIHVCNPNAAACNFSLAIKPTGAEAFAKAVLFNNCNLDANETFSVGALAIPKNAAVVVKSSAVGVVFTLTGSFV